MSESNTDTTSLVCPGTALAGIFDKDSSTLIHAKYMIFLETAYGCQIIILTGYLTVLPYTKSFRNFWTTLVH